MHLGEYTRCTIREILDSSTLCVCFYDRTFCDFPPRDMILIRPSEGAFDLVCVLQYTCRLSPRIIVQLMHRNHSSSHQRKEPTRALYIPHMNVLGTHTCSQVGACKFAVQMFRRSRGVVLLRSQ